jgi:hypothetical protein
VFFTHPEFPGVELSAAQNKIKVVAEGHPSGFWGDAPAPTKPPPVNAPVAGNEAIDGDVFFAQNNAEDIAQIRAEGFEVNDDNDPAPENIPQGNEPVKIDGNLYEGQTWGWNGVDRRVTEGGNYDGSSFTNGWMPTGKTRLDVFLHLFPVAWLTNVVLAMTSSACLANNSKALTWGELLRYLRLRLLMASSPGWHVDEFWRYETTPRDQESDSCPYDFKDFMSKRLFQAITRSLQFTSSVPPNAYVDKFWQIRAWNEHMANIFLAAWIVCLDKSMSIWHNKWTCPGWVFCPRKPHPFGNEYHSACCALLVIMFVIKLVEGKDAPAALTHARPFESIGKTAGLLLRMLQSYFGTGRYIVLDSGFCVLKAIVELKRHGLFGCALIKKRRFWLAGVPGDAIDDFFRTEGVEVGDCRAISGTMDGIPYNFWGMKEPDYVMKMMACGGMLKVFDHCKETSHKWIEGGVECFKRFCYACPFDWHF